MAKRQRIPEGKPAETRMDLKHLRRESRTALELAIVALAPTELIVRLAAAAGLLEVLSELPPDCAPALALAPQAAVRARSALGDWSKWEKRHLPKALA